MQAAGFEDTTVESTVLSSRIEDVDRIRLLGAVAVLIGGIGFAIYPYHMYFHYSVPIASDHWLLHLAYLLWPVWAAAVAWGLATLRYSTIRSLTPPFAALAVLFPLVPAAIESFRRPITDGAMTPYIRNWEPPAGPLDVLARALAEHPFILLGSTLFLLLGVAWARGQRRWFAAGLVALSGYGAIHDVVEPEISVGFLLSPLRAAIPGAILFYVGYRLAAPRDDIRTVDPPAWQDMIETHLDRAEWARLRGALLVLLGITGLLLWPIHEYHFTVNGLSTMPLFLGVLAIFWPLWASVTAWGLATLVTAEIRSLTPPWASLAVPLALVPPAIVTFERPDTDAVPPPDSITYWQPPAGPLEVVVRTLAEAPFGMLGSSLFLLLGVAWVRGQRGWLAAGAAGLFLYAGIHEFVYQYSGGGLSDGLFHATIPGAVVFYLGCRFAAKGGADDRSDAAAESGTKTTAD